MQANDILRADPECLGALMLKAWGLVKKLQTEFKNKSSDGCISLPRDKNNELQILPEQTATSPQPFSRASLCSFNKELKDTYDQALAALDLIEDLKAREQLAATHDEEQISKQFNLP